MTFLFKIQCTPFRICLGVPHGIASVGCWTGIGFWSYFKNLFAGYVEAYPFKRDGGHVSVRVSLGRTLVGARLCHGVSWVGDQWTLSFLFARRNPLSSKHLDGSAIAIPTGDALLYALHGPFYSFLAPSFRPLPNICFAFLAQYIISANGLGCFASSQGALCFFPICSRVNVACIHALGFQSNSNLFPTLAQPFVFDFWLWPGCKIPM